jgi:peroxiredoxin
MSPRSIAALLLTLAGTTLPHLAQATLPVGAPAPVFTADGAVGGKAFKFDLAAALKKGPVVLYFYPKAFTQGCTVEAHQFAEATDKFAALGTTVVGMSNDSIDTLKKFSTEACRDKFAVLADAGGKVIKDYDSALKMAPSLADRVSYLIGTDGKIAAVHAAMDPDGHISTMLKAAEKLGGTRK